MIMTTMIMAYLISNSAVRYMKYSMYYFTLIPHGLIRTHKWPALNVSGLIAQSVRASHRYREVTGSNTVELLTFSGFYTQLLKLRSWLRWSWLTWFQTPQFNIWNISYITSDSKLEPRQNENTKWERVQNERTCAKWERPQIGNILKMTKQSAIKIQDNSQNTRNPSVNLTRLILTHIKRHKTPRFLLESADSCHVTSFNTCCSVSQS